MAKRKKSHILPAHFCFGRHVKVVTSVAWQRQRLLDQPWTRASERLLLSHSKQHVLIIEKTDVHTNSLELPMDNCCCTFGTSR